MRLNTLLGAAALFTSFSIFGCNHTEAGLQQDASQNGAAIQKAADNAAVSTKKATANAEDATKKAADNAEAATKKATVNAEDATKKAAKNVDAALTVTPKVKLAILHDSELGDNRKTIMVVSENNVVHLRGTVNSEHVKNKAGEIAKRVLAEIHATDTVSNELQVNSPHG